MSAPGALADAFACERCACADWKWLAAVCVLQADFLTSGCIAENPAALYPCAGIHVPWINPPLINPFSFLTAVVSFAWLKEHYHLFYFPLTFWSRTCFFPSFSPSLLLKITMFITGATSTDEWLQVSLSPDDVWHRSPWSGEHGVQLC